MHSGALSKGGGSTSISKYLNLILVFLVTWFLAFRLYERELSKVFEPFLYILLIYCFYRFYHGRGKFFLSVLFISSLLVPIISWQLLSMDFPEYSYSSPRSEDLADKFIFIFLGFFFFVNYKKLPFFLTIFSVVILLIPWLSGDGFSELLKAWNGSRVGYGLVSIRVALLFGVVVLLLLSLMLLGDLSWGIKSVLFAVFLAALLIIFMTQTRAAFLGLLICFFASAVFYFRNFFDRRKLVIMLSGLLLVGFIVAETHMLDGVVKRFSDEQDVIVGFISGEHSVEELRSSSIGLRLKFWDAALEYGSERFWFGWGYKGGNTVMEYSGIISEDDTFHNTVHNAYLELFVRYGFIGFLVVMLSFSWTVYYFYKAISAGYVPVWLAFFLVNSIFYFAFMSIFTSDLFYWQSVYLYNFIMSIFFACSCFYCFTRGDNILDQGGK